MKRFRLHSLFPMMLLILVMMNRFFDLGTVFYLLCGVFFIFVVYCTVLYLCDRKEIHMLLAAPFFWLEYVLVVVTILLVAFLLYVDFFNEDLLPSQKGISGLWFIVSLGWLVPYVIGHAIMEKYLNSNKLLESGVRVGRVAQKKYTWDQVKKFEVNDQKSIITLTLHSGKAVLIHAQYPEFDFKISEIEMFLREKISAQPFPLHS